MQHFGKSFVLEGSGSIEGVGLHSGTHVTMQIGPRADNGKGIRFLRETGIPIELDYRLVEITPLCTLIKGQDGTEVQTVEHILSALFMMGVESADIALNAKEIPIMDGSAKPFLELLHRLPKREIGQIDWISASRPFEVKAGFLKDGFVRYEPLSDDEKNCMECHFEIDYKNKVIGKQKQSIKLCDGGDDAEGLLGSARTFCLLRDLKQIQQMGLAKGGSLENALVIGEDSVVNDEGFRMENECVKHKLMDSLGDIWTCGKYIRGKIHFYKSGHALNNKFLRTLMQKKK